MYVSKEGVSLKVSHSSSSEEYYPLEKILSVQPFYFSNLPAVRGAYAKVTVQFEGDTPDLDIFMDQTNNQPNWTVSQAGVDQAASDINKWAAEFTDQPSDKISSSSGNVSGDYWAIYPIEGTATFTTCTPLSSEYPDYSGETIDKPIYGRWTDIEVSSGIVAAYKY